MSIKVVYLLAPYWCLSTGILLTGLTKGILLLDIMLLSIKVVYLLCPFWCLSTGILIVGYYVAVHSDCVFAPTYEQYIQCTYIHIYLSINNVNETPGNLSSV
jgi:hypothetical protein